MSIKKPLIYLLLSPVSLYSIQSTVGHCKWAQAQMHWIKFISSINSLWCKACWNVQFECAIMVNHNVCSIPNHAACERITHTHTHAAAHRILCDWWLLQLSLLFILVSRSAKSIFNSKIKHKQCEGALERFNLFFFVRAAGTKACNVCYVLLSVKPMGFFHR